MMKNNIECVIIKTEHVEGETEFHDYATATDKSENNNSNLANCLDRLFGANYLNCNGIHIKTESELAPEVTNLKNGHPGHGRYKIEYKNKTPCTELLCKPEKVFDKTSSKYRLKCPNCYFLTDNRGNLKQHMRAHQKPRGDKFYRCQLCNFETKYNNSIKGHVLRHEVTKLKKGKSNLGSLKSI